MSDHHGHPIAGMTARTIVVGGDAWKYAALAAYACWVLIVGAHHEHWFDEAQAWLLARDNSLFDLMAHRVRYEGSPGLWHGLLWLLIRAGLPYSGFYLVPATLAIAGAAVILWRAPFPPIARLLVLGSYFYGFQFSVVARSYAIDLLLIPLLAACFASRAERPIRYGLLIGLLANCNAHSFVLAAVLGLEFAWVLTKSRFRSARGPTIGLLLAAGLGLIALTTAWQPADNDYSIATTLPLLARVLNYLREGLVDSSHPLSVAFVGPGDKAWGALLSMAVMLLTAALLARSSIFAVSAAMAAALVAFSTYLYASPWHSGLLMLWWLFALWIGWSDILASRRRWMMATILMTAVLGVQAAQSAITGLWDCRNAYSSAPRVAIFVVEWQKAHPAGKIVAIGYKPFELQPYFPQNIFTNYHEGQARPAYARWDRREPYHYVYDRQVASFEDALERNGDMVLAQTAGMTPAILARCLDLARRHGYRPARFYRAHQMWRAHRAASESILVFERV
jgi:hypothetical protein